MSPEMWRALLFLVLESWNATAWEVRQQMAAPLPERVSQPLQRYYQVGRHHLEADLKSHPVAAPAPDPMDEVLTTYLRDMADCMAPHYELRG